MSSWNDHPRQNQTKKRPNKSTFYFCDLTSTTYRGSHSAKNGISPLCCFKGAKSRVLLLIKVPQVFEHVHITDKRGENSRRNEQIRWRSPQSHLNRCFLTCSEYRASSAAVFANVSPSGQFTRGGQVENLNRKYCTHADQPVLAVQIKRHLWNQFSVRATRCRLTRRNHRTNHTSLDNFKRAYPCRIIARPRLNIRLVRWRRASLQLRQKNKKEKNNNNLHGHAKLFQPLLFQLFGLEQEFKAGLAMVVGEVESVGPL